MKRELPRLLALLAIVAGFLLCPGCATPGETPSDGRVYQFAIIYAGGKLADAQAVPAIWQDAAGDVSSASAAKADARGTLKAAVTGQGSATLDEAEPEETPEPPIDETPVPE